jgi:hypothetical protein
MREGADRPAHFSTAVVLGIRRVIWLYVAKRASNFIKYATEKFAACSP